MRFQPISEDEAKEYQKPGYLLYPGEADFDVKTATLHEKQYEDGTTSTSFKLIVHAWDSQGKEADIYCYLPVSGRRSYLLRHAAYSVGLGHAYESGEMEPADFNGKGGRCIVRNVPPKDGYEAKNEVQDFIVADRTKDSTNYQKSKSDGAGAVVLEREKRAAWEAFKTKHAGKDDAMLATHWRQAIATCFGGRTANTLGAVEWKRFLADGFEPAKSPVGAEAEFKDDGIPF